MPLTLYYAEQEFSILLGQTFLLRIFIFISVLFFISCNDQPPKHEVQRSFYYWKSVFTLSPAEKHRLETLRIKTLYIKFFDAAWDEERKEPVPIAQVRLADIGWVKTAGIEVVPVIFITNECIQKIDAAQTVGLAANILALVRKIILRNQMEKIPEIQIDCDWTAETKSKYFQLLKKLQQLEKNIPFSATIRLHQVKFSGKTGIPPVKRGILMCYNMGNLTHPATNNSILEIAELKKYIAHLDHYPLPLDAALSLFEWKVLFRNGSFRGLVQDLPDSQLIKGSFSKKGNSFIAEKNISIAGYDFKKEDVIRTEESDIKDVMQAAGILNDKISNSRLRVSLYHLDTVILKKYSAHEMEDIYDGMR